MVDRLLASRCVNNECSMQGVELIDQVFMEGTPCVEGVYVIWPPPRHICEALTTSSECLVSGSTKFRHRRSKSGLEGSERWKEDANLNQTKSGSEMAAMRGAKSLCRLGTSLRGACGVSIETTVDLLLRVQTRVREEPNSHPRLPGWASVIFELLKIYSLSTRLTPPPTRLQYSTLVSITLSSTKWLALPSPASSSLASTRL